jgi:hypothetical protein
MGVAMATHAPLPRLCSLTAPPATRPRIRSDELSLSGPSGVNASEADITLNASAATYQRAATSISAPTQPAFCGDGHTVSEPQVGWFELPSSRPVSIPSVQHAQLQRPPPSTQLASTAWNGIPAAVKEAVENYQPAAGFVTLPQRPNERSFIFNRGARVQCEMEGVVVVGWICLGSQRCRDTPTFLQLYSGKTSRATKHLKDVHGVSSEKTAVEDNRKRARDEEVARVLSAARTQEECQRISLLLQTLLVVNNNLPFVMGEWKESEVLKAVVTKEDFKTVVNRHTITHAVIELYASGKAEVAKFILENLVDGVGGLTMVTDVWLAKHLGTKFMGLRVYLIDHNFQLRSILLGTRHFQPMYGERAAGIGGPFKRWINRVLEDFNLSERDFYGATSDGGSDVKRMMRSGFKLKWEWCIPHLTNAATKTAFGLTGDPTKSKNPDVLALLRRVTQTTFQVKTVSSMGDLYEQLTQLLQLGKAKSWLTTSRIDSWG